MRANGIRVALGRAADRDHASRSSTTPFFTAARALVVIGTFADPSYGGNKGGAGWMMIGIDHRPTLLGAIRLVRRVVRSGCTEGASHDATRTYAESETVDFVIVGSGAAGGVLAKELSTAGFDVVVLEQGPWQQPSQFTHDELAVERQFEMLNIAVEPVQTYPNDRSRTGEAGTPGALLAYRRGVGGSSVHFAANYWRFRPIDFNERSRWGSISGTGFADWPITYEELEPYYTKVDWEIGVSGAPGPFDARRARGLSAPAAA